MAWTPVPLIVEGKGSVFSLTACADRYRHMEECSRSQRVGLSQGRQPCLLALQGPSSLLWSAGIQTSGAVRLDACLSQILGREKAENQPVVPVPPHSRAALFPLRDLEPPVLLAS